jgi:hypothetical protein
MQHERLSFADVVCPLGIGATCVHKMRAHSDAATFASSSIEFMQPTPAMICRHNYAVWQCIYSVPAAAPSLLLVLLLLLLLLPDCSRNMSLMLISCCAVHNSSASICTSKHALSLLCMPCSAVFTMCTVSLNTGVTVESETVAPVTEAAAL